MTAQLPNASDREKRGRLLEFLSEGKVLIQVDTRHEGVDVPDEVSGQPLVSFRLSHKFHLDVFEIGPSSVVASLSFDTGSYRCTFPWSAIFCMTSEVTGDSAIFEESAPDEYLPLIQALKKAQDKLERVTSFPEPEGPSHSEASDRAPEPVDAQGQADQNKKTASILPGRPHLTLVE